SGDGCLDGWVGARGGVVRGGGVTLGVTSGSMGEASGGACGEAMLMKQQDRTLIRAVRRALHVKDVLLVVLVILLVNVG
nr:hypothetical protein [Tanacetum cinerariifolium]